MPCGGPSQEYAFKRADEAYEEIISLLENKYHVLNARETRFNSWPGLETDLEKARADLRASVRELIWSDDCASW